MKMERKILCDQYGLIWFCGIMTFRHLGLAVAARDGETSSKWGKENCPLTENYGKPDEFVEDFLQFFCKSLEYFWNIGLTIRRRPIALDLKRMLSSECP